jgi:hypothetical protein
MKRKNVVLLVLTSLSLLAGCKKDSSASSDSASASISSTSTSTVISTTDDLTAAGDKSRESINGTYPDYSLDNADYDTVLSAETAPETYDAFPEDGHITKDGNYLIEGTTTTGIEIDKSLTVHLFLKNAVISSTTGSSLFSGKKAKVTITAMEGTTNSVTNAVADVNAIHIKGTLYLNGKGTLSVTSTTKGCIKSSGYLGMKDIQITVSSVSHAISGEEI